jgi:hypothetical protein
MITLFVHQKQILLVDTRIEVLDPDEQVLQSHMFIIFVIAYKGTMLFFNTLTMGKHLPRNVLVPFF